MNARPSPVGTFGFCTIKQKEDTDPQLIEHATFDDFAQYLDSHVHMVPITQAAYAALEKEERARYKNGPAVILAQFDQPGVRSSEHVVRTFGLGLDVDMEHVELERLKEVLDGFSCIIHESASSTKQRRSWRVFIEYAQALTPEQHSDAFDHWVGIIPGVSPSVKNPDRLWFAVTQFKGSGKRIFERLHGKPYSPGKRKALSPKDAFRKHIPLPVDELAGTGDRNNALSRFALSRLMTCASREELEQALLEQNAKYPQPLQEKEARAIAARKWKVRAKFGWVMPAAEPVDDAVADSLGIDASLLFAHAAGEVPWLVQDMLTYGAHLLVGRPKGGKSWITMDLALAVGSAGQFLNKQCTRCDVLWIASEDTVDSLARRLQVRGQRPAPGITVMTSEHLKAERKQWEECTFEQWLRAYLEQHPSVGLVIMDTHKTCEAIWQAEQIDQKRHASVVDIAYQAVRIYEDIGQETKTAVVLVHHAGKLKNNKDADYHERINMPATAVAGATASFVLADPPDRDIHDEDDHRRVFAIRGRHIIVEVPMLIELKGGKATYVGEYHEVMQTEAQNETMEVVEALLAETTPDRQNQRWVTYKAVAGALGKHEKTVAGHFKAMKKDSRKMVWKGLNVVLKQGKGVSLQ